MINKILNKFSEENKVELKVTDYRKYSERIFKHSKKIRSLVSEYASLSKKLISIRGQAQRASFDAEKIYQEAEKQYLKDSKAAKELGVDVKIFRNPFMQVKKDSDNVTRIAENIIQRTSKLR